MEPEAELEAAPAAQPATPEPIAEQAEKPAAEETSVTAEDMDVDDDANHVDTGETVPEAATVGAGDDAIGDKSLGASTESVGSPQAFGTPPEELDELIDEEVDELEAESQTKVAVEETPDEEAENAGKPDAERAADDGSAVAGAVDNTAAHSPVGGEMELVEAEHDEGEEAPQSTEVSSATSRATEHPAVDEQQQESTSAETGAQLNSQPDQVLSSEDEDSDGEAGTNEPAGESAAEAVQAPADQEPNEPEEENAESSKTPEPIQETMAEAAPAAPITEPVAAEEPQPPEESAVEDVEIPIETFINLPSDDSSEASVQTPELAPVNANADAPVDPLIQSSEIAPAETVLDEVPVEVPVQSLVQTPEPTSAEMGVQVPVDSLMQTPVDAPLETTTEPAIGASTDTASDDEMSQDEAPVTPAETAPAEISEGDATIEVARAETPVAAPQSEVPTEVSQGDGQIEVSQGEIPVEAPDRAADEAAVQPPIEVPVNVLVTAATDDRDVSKEVSPESQEAPSADTQVRPEAGASASPEVPAEKPIEAPIETRIDAAAKATVPAPAENPSVSSTDASLQSPDEAPAHAAGDAPVEVPPEISVEIVPDVPFEAPADAPVGTATEESESARVAPAETRTETVPETVEEGEIGASRERSVNERAVSRAASDTNTSTTTANRAKKTIDDRMKVMLKDLARVTGRESSYDTIQKLKPLRAGSSTPRTVADLVEHWQDPTNMIPWQCFQELGPDIFHRKAKNHMHNSMHELMDKVSNTRSVKHLMQKLPERVNTRALMEFPRVPHMLHCWNEEKNKYYASRGLPIPTDTRPEFRFADVDVHTMNAPPAAAKANLLPPDAEERKPALARSEGSSTPTSALAMTQSHSIAQQSNIASQQAVPPVVSPVVPPVVPQMTQQTLAAFLSKTASAPSVQAATPAHVNPVALNVASQNQLLTQVGAQALATHLHQNPHFASQTVAPRQVHHVQAQPVQSPIQPVQLSPYPIMPGTSVPTARPQQQQQTLQQAFHRQLLPARPAPEVVQASREQEQRHLQEQQQLRDQEQLQMLQQQVAQQMQHQQQLLQQRAQAQIQQQSLSHQQQQQQPHSPQYPPQHSPLQQQAPQHVPQQQQAPMQPAHTTSDTARMAAQVRREADKVFGGLVSDCLSFAEHVLSTSDSAEVMVTSPISAKPTCFRCSILS